MKSILFLITLSFLLQNAVFAQVEAVKNDKLPYHYLVYYPDGYKENPNKKYPLIMFLHGRSIQGRDLEKVKSYGVIYEILRGLKIDFVVVAPQCQNAWYLAGAYPDRFAACIPVAGGGKVSDAKNLKNLPLWVFHGVKDVPVPVEESRKMVKAIRAEGNKRVEYTERKDWDHGAAVHTFAMPEIYEWFLKYERGGLIEEPEPPLVVVDEEPPFVEPEPPVVVVDKPTKKTTKPATEPEELPYLDFENNNENPAPTPKPAPKPIKKAKWWQFWKWAVWQKLK